MVDWDSDLLILSWTFSIQDALPIPSLISVIIGTMAVEVLAAVFRLGDTPRSELGGEPTPAVLTFTKDPQLNAPGSVGGVMTGTSCSICALADGGLPVEDSSAPSSWGSRPIGGRSE